MNQQEPNFLERARIRKEKEERLALEEKAKNNGIIFSEQIIELEIIKLIYYKNQPFKPYTKDELQNLIESIERIGLQNPIIVRKKENGYYEILAGHNRVAAYKEMGREKIEARIYELEK